MEQKYINKKLCDNCKFKLKILDIIADTYKDHEEEDWPKDSNLYHRGVDKIGQILDYKFDCSIKCYFLSKEYNTIGEYNELLEKNINK
jgi:hypothetical protein